MNKKYIAIKAYRLRRLFWRIFRHVPASEKIHFDVETINIGHNMVSYRGVKAIKCPFDYVMYQMILTELQPDLVIEIGTSEGGGALYLADLMNIIGHGMIHTIDIKTPVAELVRKHPRIKTFDKGWQGYDLLNAKGFSKILVIEDASHMYEDTLGALEKFSPLVSVGSYFIVEDGIVSDFYGREKGFHGGPLRAVREFLSKNKNFKTDRYYCDMFGKNATWNVNGYLKRIS